MWKLSRTRADAWTREAVQRIVSHASQSWDEPTTPQHDAEENDQEEEADGTIVDRHAEYSDDNAYSEVEEEQWTAS